MEPRSYWQNHVNSVSIALAIVAVPLLLLTGTSRAQELYVYPAKGQSQAKQDRDRYECHSWAVTQTGFDPSRSQSAAPAAPAASNQPMPARGHVLRGAGRGAALGAVGGAIAGDAGKGAAAGGAVGALAGGMRRRDQRVARNQQQQVASQTAAKSQQNQLSAYNRAMVACMTGRGYTVN
jgi:Glycine-zipper domain